MTQSPNAIHSRLLNTVSYAGLFSAAVAGCFTFEAIDHGLQASGLGNFGTALAIGAGLAMTGCYAGFLHLLSKGIAPLRPEDRLNARPLIAGGTALILLGSAYPNVIVAGGGIAAGIEDRSYIAAVAAAGDSLKSAAQSAEQIETIITSGAGKISGLADLESSGGLSGSPTPGALTDVMSAKARALLDIKIALSDPKSRIADEISRIDQATDKMRAALVAKDMTPEGRRTLMQRHGDEARSAAIAIRAVTPVAALSTLADDLAGPQIEPKWSRNAEIRLNQEDGFRKFREELKRIGKAIARQTTDLADALKVNVPVYDPPPTSVLVVKHWTALTNAYALALALDGLPLLLYFACCVLHDGARRGLRVSPPDATIVADDADGVPLGVHPHRSAAKARSMPRRENGLE